MSWKDTFNEVVELIEKHAQLAEFFGPVTQEQINCAEDLLELKFADSYVAFLKKCGVGNFSDAEFFGIINGNTPAASAPCAVWFTMDERKNMEFP